MAKPSIKEIRKYMGSGRCPSKVYLAKEIQRLIADCEELNNSTEGPKG